MDTTDLDAAVESLLIQPEPEAETEDPEPQEATGEDEAQDEGTEEAQSEDAEAEDDDETEEVEASDDDEEDEVTEEDDGEKQPDLITVKVDGEEKQVTLDDLKRAYSGQDYIQKGMQEAAAKRKEAEALYSQIEAQRDQFLQAFQQMQQTGIKAPPAPPDQSLIDSDPIGYMQDKARYDAEMQEYQAQQQQLQQMQAQQTQAQQQARALYLQEQQQKLATLVPEFGDAEKAPEFQRRLIETAESAYGFSKEELAGVVDARHVQVLADAAKWRELQSGKAVKKKQPQPSKSVKPTGRRKPSKNLERQKQLQRARKSGRPEDFVDLLLDPNG